jgi:hypothetical protein
MHRSPAIRWTLAVLFTSLGAISFVYSQDQPIDTDYVLPDDLIGIPLSEYKDWEGTDPCSTYSESQQREMDEFREKRTRLGLCFYCNKPTGPAYSAFHSETNVAETQQSLPQILQRDLRCDEAIDQYCLPNWGGPPKLPPNEGKCGVPTPPGSPIETRNGTYTPIPLPGPNGELVCNSDCSPTSSLHNYTECTFGVTICHYFSACSDGDIVTCTVKSCGSCGLF